MFIVALAFPGEFYESMNSSFNPNVMFLTLFFNPFSKIYQVKKDFNEINGYNLIRSNQMSVQRLNLTLELV